MTVSEFLGAQLKERGWSQSEFARVLSGAGHEVSKQRVNNWIGGVSRPENELLPLLCSALDLDALASRDLYAMCGIPLPATLQPSGAQAAS